MDELVSERITGSEGALTPSFSPNGEWLTFFANGGIHKLPLEGGAAIQLVTDTRAQVPSWGDDGNVYFADDTTIWRVSAAGGAREAAYEFDGEGILGARLQVLPARAACSSKPARLHPARSSRSILPRVSCIPSVSRRPANVHAGRLRTLRRNRHALGSTVRPLLTATHGPPCQW